MRSLALLLVLLTASASLPQAQGLAARLTVHYGGVELQRANTTQWFRLPLNALMPIGPGDRLRTNHIGRALINFDDLSQILLLPYSEWQLERYEAGAVGSRLLSGRVVIRALGLWDDFTLETSHARLTQAAQHFMLETSDQASVLLVAEGQARMEAQGQARTVLAQGATYGLRIDAQGLSEALLVPYPSYPARLLSLLEGCIGLVQARGAASLNIREGAGEGYQVMNVVANGTPVLLMGQTPRRERYRIASSGGFGWILASGVQTRCQTLPVFPYSTLELVYGAISANAPEIDMLRPFYGAPQDNFWFYLGYVLPERR